jgi:hypothetical protein
VVPALIVPAPSGLYSTGGGAFKCKACGSREVTLFAIESQAELDEIQQALAGPKQPAQAPTTHARPDPDRSLI